MTRECQKCIFGFFIVKYLYVYISTLLNFRHPYFILDGTPKTTFAAQWQVTIPSPAPYIVTLCSNVPSNCSTIYSTSLHASCD